MGFHKGFVTGNWNEEIDVRDFIQKNYKPYYGDHKFLAPATKNTKKIMGTSDGTNEKRT